MQFLYPQFLWALLALLVPLIIHLFNFRRFTTLYFSDTRLLQNLVKQSRAINRLKHLLIMLLRMLAIACLVLAFANPFIPAEQGSSGELRYLSIYLDNSPSMTSGELQANKISEVRSKAAEFLKALPANYRVQILSNDFSGRQMRYYSPPEALGLVDEIEESYSSRNISALLKRVETTNQENGIDESDIYLFSDFQEGAFKSEELLVGQERIHAVMPSLNGPTSNISIDTVWFYEPVLQPGFDQSLRAKLSYSGDGEEQEIALSLAINDEVQGVQKVLLEAGSTAEAEFTIRTQESNFYSGYLEIDAGDDPAFDNKLYFNFQVAKPFRIILTGSNRNLASYQNLFRDSIYQLDYTPESAIDYGELSNYDLIIVDSPENLSSGFQSAVQENLSNGKNLVIIPANDNTAAVSQLLSKLAKPGIGGKKPGLKARSISWEDPHFSQVFSNTSDKPALPSSEFYFSYPASAGYPLIKLENGSPLVTRLPSGNGDIILFLSSLDSSGLKRQPLIVPLILNAALFSRENQSLYTIAGKSNGPAYPAPENGQAIAVQLPNGDMIPRQRQKGNLLELFELPSSIEPGTYNIVDGNTISGMISMNTEPEESRWNFLTFEELSTQYGGGEPIVLQAESTALEEMIKRQYEGISLWKWFIAAAILFLLLELMLLKIWK